MQMQGTRKTNCSGLLASEDPSLPVAFASSPRTIPSCKFLLSRLLLAALVSRLRQWHSAFWNFLWFAQGWDFDKPGHWTLLSNQDLFAYLNDVHSSKSSQRSKHAALLICGRTLWWFHDNLRYFWTFFFSFLFSNFQIRQYIDGYSE